MSPEGSGEPPTEPDRAAHLQRFVDAQAVAYCTVLAELRGGRKESHWIWFIFPQLAGLGRSVMSEAYAIRSLDEARAYLAHPILGPRLHECARLILASGAPSAGSILGPLDAMKLRSSMTLFHHADPADPVFASVLERCFGGRADPLTEARL
ncbi:MAG TPA: DUF1810 domain-containing protein [Candidatus Sulfotelmatobacter sp.]|nr:DUF1810 domain-containing protein [Candidatus Sulfotelmatobacter sp.]